MAIEFSFKPSQKTNQLF